MRPVKARPATWRDGCLLFEGSAAGWVDCPRPEDFQLTRVDGKEVRFWVARSLYDLPGWDRELRKRVRELVIERGSARGVRFFLDYRPSPDERLAEEKLMKESSGRLELFGQARLEPGVRYRLSWTCRPVGSARSAKACCDFVLPRQVKMPVERGS
jgi:hypothetical protein